MYKKLAVLATATVLLAAACATTYARSTNPTGSGPSRAKPPSYASAPCPNPIYGTGLDLGAGFQCGNLTVPEDRSKADGRTIRLAVAVRKATVPNPKPDPILFLTGGPGGSGLGEGPGVARKWQLVFPAVGHGASRWAPTCVANVMASFSTNLTPVSTTPV